MPQIFRGKSLLIPFVISGLGVMTVASAQTGSSPFAKKVKKQAWETEGVVPSAPSAPTASPYASPGVAVETYQAPSTNSFQDSARRQVQERTSIPATSYNYQPKPVSPFARSNDSSADQLAGAVPVAPRATVQTSGTADSGTYYPGRSDGGQNGGQYQYQPQAAQNYTYPAAQRSAQGQPPYSAPHSAKPRNKWLDKLGLSGITLAAKGFLKIGGAIVDRNGSDDTDFEFVTHGRLEVEASGITDGGMEYGVNLEARQDYDRFRRGFGGLVGDCPPDVEGCSSGFVDGTPTGLRGHTSQFYSTGPSNATDTQIALESAHIFLRTAYGDVTAGWDDGAAYLFSLGAPSLMAVNASNSAVDYTGLDSVKTVNDASGFAEKITYTSPRLLGDQIGVGVQFGASYALNARACGVDYCVRRNSDDESGTLAPDLENVIEVGLSLDRRFTNGLNVEATATYATANNEITLDGFDDLQAWNTGLEVSLGDWTAGGSYLQSNNALSDGDYTAYDAGITWKPSAYGFTASYGHANDKNVNVKSDQYVFGIIREFDKFTLGTGVQYIERTSPFATGTAIGFEKEKATALFIEGGFKF